MEKRTIQSYLFGFLKENKVFLLFFSVFFLIVLTGNTNQIKKLKFEFKNINGDTVIKINKNKCIITVINEPCCTGCKVSLLNYLESSSVPQLYLLDWQSDIVRRKNYKTYISELNSRAIDVYSLSENLSCFKVCDSIIKFNRKNSPFQLWVTLESGNIKIKEVNYNDIFDSNYLKNEYIDSVIKFIKN